MSKEKVSTSDLLEELNTSIKLHGVKATMDMLRQNNEKAHTGHIQFVVAMVCRQFTISIEQMMQEKNETTKYAKGFIVFYLRNDFKIEWATIKVVLDHKDQSWLWQLMKMIKELKPKLPVHAKWLTAKNNFDGQLKEYFKQQKK